MKMKINKKLRTASFNSKSTGSYKNECSHLVTTKHKNLAKCLRNLKCIVSVESWLSVIILLQSLKIPSIPSKKNHEFQLHQFSVMCKCNSSYKAKIHKALLIKKQNPVINKQMYVNGASFLLSEY